ncbi:GIY-YIG nuclease family protein [Marinilactibacillus piezotolerans]|uniref:GIY-YIG nuclease family protein n=1 Tax=Marinilactibacillus piezotolerans TaxID=258723 RepID=UPI0009AFAFAA|nr:GIY-YIG nuclease family protein [Marinilactibacillus piezotolerans]
METTSYFYVLRCKDGTLYGGYTTDLDRRLKEHNTGVGAKYTRPSYRRPAQMVYAEAHASRSKATKAEAAFKKLSRKYKERYLKNEGVQIPFKKTDPRIVVDKKELTDADAKEL